MALPWQDISSLDTNFRGYILVKNNKFCFKETYSITTPEKLILNGAEEMATHWFPITPPKATTVEVPVEPERVSVQEFAKDPAGKWVNTTDGCPIKGWYQIQKEGEDVMGLPFKLWDIAKKDHPIYATDPTAWLAWLAKQEGNQ